MKIKIPTDKYGWINYFKFDNDGSVYIIEENPEGKTGRYQYNGTGCDQGRIKGFIEYHFHSDNPYFNRNHWYKATGWGNKYPEEIVFENKTTKKIMDTVDWSIDWSKPETQFDKQVEKVHEQVTQYGVPTKSILEQIIQEVKEKTGINTWECNANFQKDWFESHIIIQNNNKKYLLTWENCD